MKDAQAREDHREGISPIASSQSPNWRNEYELMSLIQKVKQELCWTSDGLHKNVIKSTERITATDGRASQNPRCYHRKIVAYYYDIVGMIIMMIFFTLPQSGDANATLMDVVILR